MAQQYTEQLSVTVTPGQKKSLQQHAQKRLTNVSQLVRQAIDVLLEKLALEDIYREMANKKPSE